MPAQLRGLVWLEMVDNGKRINGKMPRKTFPRSLVSRLTCSKWPFLRIRQTCFFSSYACAQLVSLLDTLFSIVVFICPCVHAFSFLYPPPVLSQGLRTEAHQCDGGAPQWQLPSAAGPWPVPRCLRRWCSPSAHCFLFCVSFVAVNAAAIQWTDPQLLGWGPRPSRLTVCVAGASAVQPDSAAFLGLCCWIVQISLFFSYRPPLLSSFLLPATPNLVCHSGFVLTVIYRHSEALKK